MNQTLFITSTGTGIGKTFITQKLVEHFREFGLEASKPIISGWDPCDETLDTIKLIKAMKKPLTQETIENVSPFRFKAPLSPDQAAALEDKEINFQALVDMCLTSMRQQPLLIEGVGGVMVPLTHQYTVLDWVKALQIPVLLVVGSYLGTLSHTLTALSVFESHHVPVAGVIVNQSEDCVGLQSTLNSLSHFCGKIPMIGWGRNEPISKEMNQVSFFNQLTRRTL